ncbi:MAG: helix-turn-helix domain-containing protein [Myxococcaceae bacterium]|nr:helix-turn-helix domain-containing protein [Myxococcaceae bacterium]
MTKSLERMLEELLAEVREVRSWGALPTVLTKRRAARELGVSPSKLKQLIRRGELAVCQVGRSTMVPASEVQRIAASARRKPAAPGRARKEKRPTSPAEEARAVRSALKDSPRRPS